MKSEVNEDFDNLCKDFKRLSSGKQKGVVKTARLLLEIQRHTRELLRDKEGTGIVPWVPVIK
jgi:hypothetical protein